MGRTHTSTSFQEPSTSIARAPHQRVPRRLRGAGTLYLWLRPGRTSRRILRTLRATRRSHEMVDSCACVALHSGEVQPCTAELVESISVAEAQETRALFLAGPGRPALSDFARMTTLYALDVLAQSGWILDQLAEGRFTSYFHPIVHAQEPSRVFAHEALLRGVERDGSLVAPQPILSLAREAGLLVEVDSAACLSAIRESAHLAKDMCVFINFSPAAILDPETSLRAMLAAIDEAGLSHERIVFEVVEADRLGDCPNLKKVLEGYRGAGFRVALDDLGAGWSTLNLVHQLLPDFIKVDRELIHGVHLDPVKGLIASKLLEIGRGLGIRTIVEGVEEPGELDWVRDHGADFVQGFLFGRPRESPSAERT